LATTHCPALTGTSKSCREFLHEHGDSKANLVNKVNG